jgi:eukaryotic-like serine/threonine-protein kinase
MGPIRTVPPNVPAVLPVVAAGSYDDSSAVFASTVTADREAEPGARWTPPQPTDPTRTSEPLPSGAAPAAASLSRTAERYQILGEHGRGGLGRVSRAHDRELGRDVAIKELIARSHVGEIRFLREAMITARLEHPGIVPVHEAGRWPDGTPYYAMKLVAGRSLRELIAERTTVGERLGLLHHVIAVADAIAYAHGRNIIHRDLKPANVIVGDFGETIVIDWGLAKDLSTAEESTIGGGPFRTAADSELTSAGAVLGTPLYMAPEQARGEPVDQRADVFAIGAMLWEVCSLERVVPGGARQRHRALRRAGIDEDLAVILDKALDPDPAWRYRDAGELAADLKAFTAGARIAARSYSLPALLAHWTRRHRTLAVAALLAAAVTAAGIALYVRNVAAERDRADRSQAVATASLNELTLKHAELLLTSDPSAVPAVIASYRGDNAVRADQIRAEAQGRGIATLQAVAHIEAVQWLRGIPGGDVISLSVDGTIARTSPDGRSRVIARDAVKYGDWAYAASRHLLVYICGADELCMLEVTSGKLVHASAGAAPLALTFSPDDRQLAVLSNDGVLRVLDIEFPAPPVERFVLRGIRGGGLLFVDRDAIAVGTKTGMKIVHPSQPDGGVLALVEPDGGRWAIGPSEHQVVVSTTTGKVYFVDSRDLSISLRTQPCRDPVAGLRTLRSRGLVAFACKGGTIGLIDPRTGAITELAHLDGHANRLEVSRSGEYLVASGDKGVVTLIDLQTRIATSFQGQAAQLTAVSAPSDEYPFVLSADARGGIRAWPLPQRLGRVVADSTVRMYSMIYSPQDRTVIGTTQNNSLLAYSPAGGFRRVGPHGVDVMSIEPAANGAVFAAYGSSSVVEIWSLSPLAQVRSVNTHHGAVSRVEFVDGAEDIVTAGMDGRLVRWSATGEPQQIHRFDQAIDTFRRLADGSIVIATEDGALWRVSREQELSAIRGAGARVTKMVTLADASLCIGYSDGTSVIWDGRGPGPVAWTRASDAIRDIAVTADGNTIALAIAGNAILLGVRGDAGWPATTWTTLTANAQRIAWTRDGVLVSVGGDGAVWLYSPARRTWLFLRTGTRDLTQILFDDAETTAFVSDFGGRLMTIDLNESRKRLGG